MRCMCRCKTAIAASLGEKARGWAGIRTPGAFQHTRFPGVHNRPLCHPSFDLLLLLLILLLIEAAQNEQEHDQEQEHDY